MLYTLCIIDFRYYLKILRLDYLYTIDEPGDKHKAESVMLQTQQGILAQAKPEMYIIGGGGYKQWLENLSDNYGIGYEMVENPWRFVEKYKDKLRGMVFREILAISKVCGSETSHWQDQESGKFGKIGVYFRG